MNKERRKSIQAIMDQIENLSSELESLKDEEQDYYDNMPESLQGGEKGGNAQNAIDYLENAISEIEQAVSSMGSALD